MGASVRGGPRPRWLACTALGLALLGAARGVLAGDKKDALREAQRAWAESATSGRLAPRVEALERLAATKEKDALVGLLADLRPEGALQWPLRNLGYPVLAEHFAGPAFEAPWTDALRSDPHGDGWLAYQACRAWIGTGQAPRAAALLDQPRLKPAARAAVLQALASAADPARLETGLDALAKAPSGGLDRAVVLEGACALIEGCLAAGARPLPGPPMERLIELLEAKGTPRRTRLVVARTLARLLESPAVYLDGPSWRKLLDLLPEQETLKREGYAVPVPKSTFLGVVAAGRNVCYVIDRSGSMSAPFQRPERPRETPKSPRSPKAGPVTGDRPEDVERKQQEADARRRGDLFEGLDQLPWERIKTRLDAVREALKASLRTLDPDQSFAVVTYATDVRGLPGAKEMTPATRANVERACRELDTLTPEGATNIHEAMEMAFAMTPKGATPDGPRPDDLHLSEGADTIFLMTDGSPNRDRYAAAAGGSESAVYDGTVELELCVRHWNLLRRCEIHCIGFDSGVMALLGRLAAVGQGKVRDLSR